MNDAQITKEAMRIAADFGNVNGSGQTHEHIAAITALCVRVRDEQREEDAKKVCRYCRIEKYGKAHYEGEYWVHTGSEEYATAVYCQATAIRQGEKG